MFIGVLKLNERGFYGLKKTVSFRATNCENCSFTGNMSYGSDVGFDIIDSKGIAVNENRHFSEQVLNAYYETMKLVHASSNEIAEKLVIKITKKSLNYLKA